MSDKLKCSECRWGDDFGQYCRRFALADTILNRRPWNDLVPTLEARAVTGACGPNGLLWQHKSIETAA